MSLNHTQGAQVWITQFTCKLHHTWFYLVHQMTPPLTEVADI